MYSPTQGRFISTDPIGFQAGDPNLYRFVGNNPTNRVDPTGLAPEPPYPDKLGEISKSIDNKSASDFVKARILGKGPGGSTVSELIEGRYKYRFKVPNVVPADNKLAAIGPGTNIAGQTHAFFGWPQSDPIKYFGTGGCQGCVGLIVVCDRGTGAIFHFSGGDDAAETIYGYKWAEKGKCTAYIFGGDDTNVSKGLLAEALIASEVTFGVDHVFLVDSDHLLVGYDGKLWVRKGK